MGAGRAVPHARHMTSVTTLPTSTTTIGEPRSGGSGTVLTARAAAEATRLSAADLARMTPDSRDRAVDLLRAASIAVVVLGHWLMAVVAWTDGRFRTGNVLGMVPGLWAATWVLQVMPVFFFVGGFSNLVSLDA